MRQDGDQTGSSAQEPEKKPSDWQAELQKKAKA
jgi:hypothetical protein